MSLRDSQCLVAPPRKDGQPRRAILLTSYQTGATRGKNLGMPGYSYDLVAQLFAPLLARWGQVIPVARDSGELEMAVAAARQSGLEPIHVSFVACQHMVFASSVPNVIVPAWEFPDLPNEAFDGNALNNWAATANRCDLVLVGGEFTVECFQRAGIRTPIRIVPVPTPDEYFALPPWSPKTITTMNCPAYVFPNPDWQPERLWDAPDVGPDSPAKLFGLQKPLRWWREHYEYFLPPLLTKAIRTANERLGCDRWRSYLRSCRRDGLDLSGIVYVSIFSPRDGRKNWQDLLTGFTSALRDCPDATLIVKLITKERTQIDSVIEFYRGMGLTHQCKIIFITDYLPDEQMLNLVRAAAYYLTTTRAEGNCLPLMNYLAAARPGVSPCHTAISDYFTEDIGLTLPWHAEPAIWPQDNRARIKTTWARLEWPALVERLRESYVMARSNRAAYEARGRLGQERMRERASMESVWKQLRSAFEYLETSRGREPRAA